MTLEPGRYFIKCKGTNTHIGRSQDNPSDPSPIYSDPKGKEPPVFIVDKSNTLEDCFVIQDTMGGLLGEKDSLLWDFQDQDEAPPTTDWLITHQQNQIQGQDVYTIEKPDNSAGWIVPDKKPQTQVAVKQLISHPSNPPKFLPTSLFQFVKADRR